MYCSACGKKCPDGARFCAYCGERLPELPPEPAPAAPEPRQASVDEAAQRAEAPAPAVSEPEPSAPEAPDEPEQAAPEAEEDEFDFGEEAPKPAAAPPEDPAHRIFQRPAPIPKADDSLTVRPYLANPAQPPRGSETVHAAVEFEDEEREAPPARRSERRAKRTLRFDPAEDEEDEGDDVDDADDEWVRPAKPRIRRAETPARDDWGDEPPVKPARDQRSRDDRVYRRPEKSRDEWEDEPVKDRFGHKARPASEDRPARPARESALNRLRAQGKAVTASGGMVTPPARRAPVRSSRPMKPRKPRRDDLFFEDLEIPRENYYDEAAEDRALSRRIRTIVALALVLCVAIVVIWFNWMPGGQVFRARFGLGASASAYKMLGDQEYAAGQIQRAANAYYDALRRDPNNYDFALLVGETQEKVGDRENAAKAYMKCVVLRPTDAEAYKRLVELYTVMGDAEAAKTWREEGYRQTMDPELAPSG
jgi:hypothetical protein